MEEAYKPIEHIKPLSVGEEFNIVYMSTTPRNLTICTLSASSIYIPVAIIVDKRLSYWPKIIEITHYNQRKSVKDGRHFNNIQLV